MHKLCLAFALLAVPGISTLSYSQVQPSPQDAHLFAYDSFFFRVMWLEDKANQLVSQGKTDAYARFVIQKEFAPTDAQTASLKAIAADYRTQFNAIQKQAKALLTAGQKGSTSPQLGDLFNQRRQVTADHINQLQMALGPMRFAALDALVALPRAPQAAIAAQPVQ